MLSELKRADKPMELVDKGVRCLDSSYESLKVSIVENWAWIYHAANLCFVGHHVDCRFLRALIPLHGDCSVVPLFLQDDFGVRNHEEVVSEILEDQFFVVNSESDHASEAVGIDICVRSE